MPERNKVIYNATTLIDLTEDTVTPETLAFGATAHSASGDIITGTAYKNTYYVAGTHTYNTNAWTGNLSEVSALYNGLTIDYWLPYSGTARGNITLALTLKDGTVNTSNVYAAEGTTQNRTIVKPNRVIRLVYQTVTINGTSYTGWFGNEYYESGRLQIDSYSDSSVGFIGAIFYYKIGRSVQISARNITLKNDLSAGHSRALATMPSGFCPCNYMYPASVQEGVHELGTGFNVTAYNTGSGYAKPYVVEIEPAGAIVLYATTKDITTYDKISISAMYFTD